jgi:hypothetical protein
MKKMPDSFVPERKTKEYPTEIGSQKFSPDNIQLFKLEKTQKVKTYFTSKFDEIQKQYAELMNEVLINERLYKANHNFEPVYGTNYFLYKRENGDEFLSLISPNEWKNKFEFIGTFQIQSDGRWIQINS